MSFAPCHIEYDLTRRQRLVGGLGVWAPYIGLVMIAAAGIAAVAGLAAAVSPWWAFAIVLPLWIVRGFILGLVNVIAVPMQHMDIIVEENGLGYATKSDRLWIFLDGIIRIQKYSIDTWTVFHHNGTIIIIPVDAIDEQYIDHMRKKGEWGRTPEGVQAVIERGKLILAIEAEQREERRHKKSTGGDVQ
jgi:hypothetical protein